MEPGFSTAFSLLAIGMITVFTVLSLVVITGNLLIRFVNAFVPVEIGQQSDQSQIDKKKIAAINAAVEVFTQGKGSITKIEKKS